MARELFSREPHGEWEGVPLYSEREFQADVSRDELMEMVLKVGELGVEDFRGWLKGENPRVHKYLFANTRRNLPYVLDLSRFSRALDVGCGYGAVSFGLARVFKEVYALDITAEKPLLVRELAQEMGLNNIQTLQANAMELPFGDGAFDAVTVVGVLEWAPLFNEGDPRQVQLQFLREMRRVLAPEGQLLVGIENRFGGQYFAGWPDHNGLRLTSTMPRALADAYSRLRGKGPYRAYTHSYGGYRELFREAGFTSVRLQAALPSYRYPKYVFPLEPGWTWKYFLRNVLLGGGLPARLARALLPVTPDSLFRLLCPHFFVKAGDGGVE